MYPRRILIAETNPVVAEDLESIFREAGYRVVGTPDSLSKLDQIVDEVDLLLMNVELLDGLSYQVVRTCGKPTAFITGYEVDDLPPDLQDCPVIRKPFCPHDVVRQAERLLGQA